MNKILFVICCKESLYIYKCVESIKKIYEDSVDIVIVDSCSNDKSYFELNKKYTNLLIEDVNNKQYEHGAILHGFKKYETYEKYVFIQDAIFIKNKLGQLENLNENEVLIFGDHANESGWWCDPEAKSYFYKNHPNFPDIGDIFLIAEWNSFAIKNSTFKKTIESDLFKMASPPDKKIMSCAWERVWAIIFIENQIQIKKFDQENFEKKFGSRA